MECMNDMEKRNANRKPVVGLLPSVDDMTGATKLSAGYMNAVLSHGGVPFLFTFLEEEADMRQLALQCDAFLFTGGIDPDPALYGEETLNDTVQISKCRDTLEFPLFQIALELDKPILGICRGIQVLNVVLGGTLYQDLPAQMPGSPVCHRQKAGYPEDGHFVNLAAGTPIAEIFGEKRVFVNTYHHQAIKALAPELLLMAAADDGIAEAVCMKERPYVFGVQWHPELIYEKNRGCGRIFDYFLACARQKMSGSC
ncbi:MAG: gamma-glutamyl-gamma-aminobutyrate hydrolase family protein [Clostridia bacterium]